MIKHYLLLILIFSNTLIFADSYYPRWEYSEKKRPQPRQQNIAPNSIYISADQYGSRVGAHIQYKNNHLYYQHRTPSNHDNDYNQGYHDGYYAGQYQHPPLTHSSTNDYYGSRSDTDNYYCEIKINGYRIYSAYAPYRDIARNRAYQACIKAQEVNACQQAKIICRAPWE